MKWLLAWLLAMPAIAPAAMVAASAPRLDDLALTVTADHPREYIFTDKNAAHLAGEAIGPNTRSYHGFYIAMHEVVDSWTMRLDDGTVLGPQTAYEAIVTPDKIVRHHRLPGGDIVTETVILFDRENGFEVVYDGIPSGEFAFQPLIDMRFLWKVSQPAYEVRWQEGALLTCRQDALTTAVDPAHPQWLAITVSGASEFRPVGKYQSTNYPKGHARRAMDHTSPYRIGDLVGRIPGRVPAASVRITMAADVSASAAQARVRRLADHSFDLTLARQDRLQRLLDHSSILTGNQSDDRALAWARISLDNLIMNQRGPGIYAGFYWFTTYWGRDTFISLPGACVVNGDFDTARTLLRSFADFQEKGPGNARLGRVPNFVTVDQVQYASIDGTWWFVRALDELWRQSGDDAFAAEMAPVVYHAVDGALAYAVDDSFFLTHGDGETWMDGGGEQHPYSPRGNRAVEVQALWHRGLLTAARLAKRFPEVAGARHDYAQLADRLATNFHASFWQGDTLVDHLNPDGSQDQQTRPNTMLAVLASPTLFTASQRRHITDTAQAELVMPWGVLSLDAADANFHPKHLDLSRYYYDEAYHNGDLWLWLSGSYISALNSPSDGFGQTKMLLDEVLNVGAIGTIQEIRDGAQSTNNDEFGGATSQAWSLAELLRNVVQDYAGLKVDLTATPPVIEVAPSLPEGWPNLVVTTYIGDLRCRLVADSAGEPSLWFQAAVPSGWTFRWHGHVGVVQDPPQNTDGWTHAVTWE